MWRESPVKLRCNGGVCQTIRGSVIRLISARKANSREVKRYDNR
ncbi:hypothetical protein CWATWH0402_4416 [Crocosphaera watsonii WH 0402]|uniref:Uncharacterized protein n=4 Tax=Crocosphaera watsonii TaxID=263511 RepID=T2JP58_CROWT|nr:hypothetical protein CWATWH0003_4768 [Crocosphaera watsonii WH 0003]CCQ58913.1 hypothetical protein CWATWH0005_1881 [Crocosphaera watsonii WH 0005]CCQ63701.1 hypothetical protein CWATWH0401_4912 [Crocosphaera watsonii WH 0401]CCQ66322.1 hypothetical protein CWATWH0402_4416 [Crocosphaera watsonii WH 0402]